MNAKEMLQSAYSLHCAILIKREQISILEDSITNITVSLDRERVSKSPDPSSMQTAIVQLIELKEEVEVDIARLADIEQKSRRLINQVSNLKARAVLSKRYLGFKSWTEIASEMDISPKWAANLHTVGIHQVESILASETDSHTSKED